MKCYAAYAKNINDRYLGSSGGIFPLLSKKIIEDGGIVYASVYDDELNVLFKRIDNNDDLFKAFTSKYMQSNSLGIYSKVKNDLQSGEKVLFCGTPCHIKALCKYLKTLGVQRGKLLTVDIICHGVPSSETFHRFMNEYCDKKCVSLNMRNKDNGWNYGNYSWKMVFDDGIEKVVQQNNIPYMKAFLSDICLRPSCYNCKSKSKKYSDITLGDFWGISDANVDLDDRYGVSCVITNTEKGQKMFEEILNTVEFRTVDYKSILDGNPSLEKSSDKHFNRDKFCKRISSCKSPEIVFNQLTDKQSLINRGKKKFSSILSIKKTSVKDIVDNNNRTLYSVKEDCCGCMVCQSVCSKGAINVCMDNEFFNYPVIDKEKCVNCKLCEKVCPCI